MLVDSLLPIREVEKRVGWKQSKIYNMVREGTFPAPFKMGRINQWAASEITAWIEEQKAVAPRKGE